MTSLKRSMYPILALLGGSALFTLSLAIVWYVFSIILSQFFGVTQPGLWYLWGYPLLGFLLGMYGALVLTSVVYHRSFTHKALTMHPRMRWVFMIGAPLICGIDMVVWGIMHAIHHSESDKPKDPTDPNSFGDPHSPIVEGSNWAVFGAQYQNYRIIMNDIRQGRMGRYERYLKLLEYNPNVAWYDAKYVGLHPCNQGPKWLTPHFPLIILSLLLIPLLLGFAWVPTAFAVIVGFFSHPVMGWIVNTRGHSRKVRRSSRGARDHSINPDGWDVVTIGESNQDTHHHKPNWANFAFSISDDGSEIKRRAWYHDIGYSVFVRFGALLRLWKIKHPGEEQSPNAT